MKLDARLSAMAISYTLFSAYEGRRNADDAEPFLRGINSFQLLYHDNRWWVVTIYWQPENEDRPIPEEYLAND